MRCIILEQLTALRSSGQNVPFSLESQSYEQILPHRGVEYSPFVRTTVAETVRYFSLLDCEPNVSVT